MRSVGLSGVATGASVKGTVAMSVLAVVSCLLKVGVVRFYTRHPGVWALHSLQICIIIFAGHHLSSGPSYVF